MADTQTILKPDVPTEIRNPFIEENTPPTDNIDLATGSYDVMLNMPPILDGQHKFLANVVVLDAGDDEVDGMIDPITRAPYGVGDTVVRLRCLDEVTTRTDVYTLDSIQFYNQFLMAESFAPIPEGKIIEEM